MFGYFYHEIIRKTIVAFGTLFNDISIVHVNDNGDVVSKIKVPLAYGPIQKFLARIEQVPDLNKPIQVTLPRMSFEMVGISYDSIRKLPQTQSFVSCGPGNETIRKLHSPVPYNLNFELSIMTKLNDDMLQIIEQIIPYFGPTYSLTVDLVKEVGEKRDISVTLDNITITDNYERDYTERRALIYTLKFTVKTLFFGPIPSAESTASEIIKNVSLGFVSGSTNSAVRDVTYSSEPRAIKNYTGVITTTVTKDVTIDAFEVNVSDATNITENTYIEINGEEMYVVSKSSNVLTVKRGQDATTISYHVSGSKVKKITQADNLLIKPYDDFGFTGSIV